MNGIQLPAFDVEMLALGKLIVVPFKQFQPEGKASWLYPCQQLPNNLSLEEYYQPEYLAKARNSWAKYSTYPIHLKFWARCEYQWRINPEQKDILPKVAQSTIWNLSALENIFEQQKVLKFSMLRVYCLSKPCIVNIPTDTGSFYWTKSEDIVNHASENDIPVVSAASFSQRKSLILSGNISPYQNIEALQFQCENISETNQDIKNLNHDIKQFLGWYSVPTIPKLDKSLDWIKTITALGDRSIELEERKNNYQAGTDFENISRQSLEFLGFKVENAYKGGAGGLDLYCSQPYPLVCECKAGKSIPSGTVQELIKLGGMHLGREQFINSAKLVIGPGNATSDNLKSSKEWKVSIIKAMTLQKLVELKAKYPGAINLLELKQYLEPGQIDDKINEYIAKIEKEIKLRSHIIQLVKRHLEKTSAKDAQVGNLCIAYLYDHPPQDLEDRELYDILIELSSPLTGYLGRIKEDDWKKDRFYYLRDLPIN
ncbi:DUF1802 family protein [Dolichospermum circinale]|uniref:DUF1802 family protein n=1 Tax=Dolichospermum circinale TaxID=109265 RepID=UPI0004263B13|nr:DUF1802 family protein [Dolichospermum circinale]MDB9474726.1 DUF1802 family protein [Dolichospermum circinale CS-537/11]MDB9477878.1 DUF1802 family protein [Dolichospermum circinale CS-537/03]